MDILVLRPTQGWGYLFPWSPEINCFVPLFPDIVLVPLKIWPLFPFSPEIIHLVPVFTKTLWDCGWGGGGRWDLSFGMISVAIFVLVKFSYFFIFAWTEYIINWPWSHYQGHSTLITLNMQGVGFGHSIYESEFLPNLLMGALKGTMTYITRMRHHVIIIEMISNVYVIICIWWNMLFLAYLSWRLTRELWYTNAYGIPVNIFRDLLLWTTDQFNLKFIWILLMVGERKFSQMFLVTWPRWPPHPYKVKTL